MKACYPIILLFILPFALIGQQNSLRNHSLFNYYLLNSAYAGSINTTSIGMGLNKQWVGLDGAPFSQYLNIHFPINQEKMGLGFRIANENIGVHRESRIDATLAYHISNQRSKLSFAMDLGVQQNSFDFFELDLQQSDPVYPRNGLVSEFIPKFGFSALFQSNYFIGGFKVSNLSRSSYRLGEMGQARDYLYANALIGIAKRINKKLIWKPYVVVWSTENHQYAYDLSSNISLYEKLTFGLSYRNSKNLNLLGHMFVRKNLRIGYSYELSLTHSKTTKPISHELFLGLNIGREKGEVVSPRFFSL